MKITKKFIKENQDKTLKELFPELFKADLIVGEWYIFESGTIGFFQGINMSSYGIHFSGEEWFDNHKWFFNRNLKVDKYRKAAPKEVEQALIQEAKKRGLVKGVYCNHEEPVMDQHKPIKNYFYHERDNCLYGNIEHGGGANIFKNGIWAEIIQPKQMTKEEIEKELGYKIEIV